MVNHYCNIRILLSCRLAWNKFHFFVNTRRQRVQRRPDAFSSFNYLRPADSVKAGGYFFYAGKTLIRAFQGIFHGDRDFFDL